MDYRGPFYDIAQYALGGVNRATTCSDPLITDTAFFQSSLIPAILIAVIICFTEKRIILWPEFLNGRPGIVYPMDILTKSDRASYVCAFGISVSVVFQYVFVTCKAVDVTGSFFVRCLVILLSLLVFGIVYYPVFVAITSRNVLGYGLGTAYVWMLTIIEMIRICQCEYNGITRASLVFDRLPYLLCLYFLAGHLPYRLYIEFKNRKSGWARNMTVYEPELPSLIELKKSELGRHVSSLLKQPQPVQEEAPGTLWEIVWRVIQNDLYKPQPGFRYSAKLLSTVLVSFILLYMIMLRVYVFLYFCSYAANNGIRENEIDQDLATIVRAFVGVTATITVLSNLIGLYNILAIMKKYRSTMREMNKGKLKDVLQHCSNTDILLGSMKYSGFQTLSIIFGCVAHFFVVFFSCGFIGLVGLLLYLMTRYRPSLGTLPIAILLLYIYQRVMCRFVFLATQHKHLVLDNRRMMFIVAYFMFFYNLFLGVFSTLKRLLTSFYLVSFLVPRLDRSMMPAGFLKYDSGYMNYLCFIKLENDHNHPVMLTFIKLLQVLAKQRKDSLQMGNTIDTMENLLMTAADHDNGQSSNRAVVFKWHLLYSLINNPALRAERKEYVQRLKRARELGVPLPKSDTFIEIDLLRQAEEEKDRKHSGDIKAKLANVAGDKVQNIKSKIQGIRKKSDGEASRFYNEDSGPDINTFGSVNAGL